ncbi:MAG: SDR family oxidoreductase [Myxococcota bacterium]|nr:SDR family oxidoreductase [Myxococcota bacterium]
MQYDGISGKVAIVTGSGGGIGEGYAKGLASHGAHVVVAEINSESGERVASEINQSGGNAEYVRVDVGSEVSTRAMAEHVEKAHGGIDFLVNNAAIFGDMKLDSLLRVDWDYYQKFMEVNMNGALLCTRACFRSMKARGGGAIVNQSSTAAWMGVGFYGLAKLGINGLTHALSRELGGQGIRINAIAPGPTDTEALAKTAGPMAQQIVNQLAIPRLGQPADLVETCLFLLSDAASWLTGQIINVDGGQITRP